MMDGQQSRDGSVTLRVGPAEKWIAGGVVALLTALIGIVYARIETQLERQTEAMGAVATQQAVMSAQITTMSGQLANVPALTERVTSLEGDVKRNREDVRELMRARK